jgi:hypothetical protein
MTPLKPIWTGVAWAYGVNPDKTSIAPAARSPVFTKILFPFFIARNSSETLSAAIRSSGFPRLRCQKKHPTCQSFKLLVLFYFVDDHPNEKDVLCQEFRRPRLLRVGWGGAPMLKTRAVAQRAPCVRSFDGSKAPSGSARLITHRSVFVRDDTSARNSCA